MVDLLAMLSRSLLPIVPCVHPTRRHELLPDLIEYISALGTLSKSGQGQTVKEAMAVILACGNSHCKNIYMVNYFTFSVKICCKSLKSCSGTTKLLFSWFSSIDFIFLIIYLLTSAMNFRSDSDVSCISFIFSGSDFDASYAAFNSNNRNFNASYVAFK